jgi:hypothetical protein
MTDFERRLRELFPSVQITSVSIIVALALENLLDRIGELPPLWAGGAPAFTLWCHALTVLAVTVKIWSGFTFNAIVLDRLPRASDVLGPLGILLLVYSLIACIAPGREFAWWTFMAAGTFVAAAYLRTHAPDATSLSPATGRPMRAPVAVELGLASAAATVAAFVWAGGIAGVTMAVFAAAYLLAQTASAVAALGVWRYARNVIAEARAGATAASPRSARPPPAADPPDNAAR